MLLTRATELTFESMATQFYVEGPLKIPVTKGKVANTITSEDVKAFWAKHPHVVKHRGCYVFAMRAGKGYTPYYVGQATRTFKRELFQPHKLAKYQRALADYHRGTPVLLLVIAPRRKGKANTSHIGQLEDFLIQVAVAANPDLLNIQGTKQERWSIAGVLRSGQGKASNAATALKRALKL